LPMRSLMYRTGPGESNLISMAIKARAGKMKTSASREKTTSNARLAAISIPRLQRCSDTFEEPCRNVHFNESGLAEIRCIAVPSTASAPRGTVLLRSTNERPSGQDKCGQHPFQENSRQVSLPPANRTQLKWNSTQKLRLANSSRSQNSWPVLALALTTNWGIPPEHHPTRSEQTRWENSVVRLP